MGRGRRIPVSDPKTIVRAQHYADRVRRSFSIDSGVGQLRSDTKPASIWPVVAAAGRPLLVQFDEPLPDALLAATADVLEV